MKILFTGGGTGGHIVPALAIARELRILNPSTNSGQFFYMGPKDEFGDMLLSQEGFAGVFHVAAGKMRRYGGVKAILQNIIDIFFRTPLGFFQALLKLFFLAPDLIMSKGGYGSLPATFAGWLLGIPIFLHESDSVPGLANRIAAKFSLGIFTSFPNTERFPKGKIELTGNPVRKEIMAGSKEEAKQYFSLQGGKPLVFIMGGSQGAQRINEMLLIVLEEALKTIEIIHQTGEKNFADMQKETKAVLSEENGKYYHPVPFLKETELRDAYAVSDLIITRAGSGSIFEIAALGKPAILIPLPESAQNHQVKNAYEYAKTGAAIVLEEANLTPHFFLEKLKDLLQNSQELEKMSLAARNFAKPEAAKNIARYLLEYLAR
ncbi:MAG: undecaprenyldiphospho-muramoylpentapeptide beta-N-acetylglucosaminyltransferase [Candidatus Wildermuthbacteria bacterium]|nr:undecaprenyldiphospho-muramoylpentapeptide beta-N-acetylglucosaminyltransferase [Candidatus Wildermuthbacteria bacterium]